METVKIISEISNDQYRDLVEEMKDFYTEKLNKNIENFKLLF